MANNDNRDGYGPPPPGYNQGAWNQQVAQQQPMQQQQYQQPMQQYPQQYYPQQPQAPAVYVQQNMHVISVKAPFSHTFHIVLDVFTCGAWLPVHLICWAVHQNARQ